MFSLLLISFIILTAVATAADDPVSIAYEHYQKGIQCQYEELDLVKAKDQYQISYSIIESLSSSNDGRQYKIDWDYLGMLNDYALLLRQVSEQEAMVVFKKGLSYNRTHVALLNNLAGKSNSYVYCCCCCCCCWISLARPS